MLMKWKFSALTILSSHESCLVFNFSDAHKTDKLNVNDTKSSEEWWAWASSAIIVFLMHLLFVMPTLWRLRCWHVGIILIFKGKAWTLLSGTEIEFRFFFGLSRLIYTKTFQTIIKIPRSETASHLNVKQNFSTILFDYYYWFHFSVCELCHLSETYRIQFEKPFGRSLLKYVKVILLLILE